jgi:hypothetical protein
VHPLEESAITIAELHCQLALVHASVAGDDDRCLVSIGSVLKLRRVKGTSPLIVLIDHFEPVKTTQMRG